MYSGYPLPKLDPAVTRTVAVFGLSADTEFCRRTSRFNVRWPASCSAPAAPINHVLA
jgi:hypothetical protein